mmetsp:Transcript_58292/g.162499  ORF Transcript_58292/g.162499 Transcript_58292/m.162499 type:complete len:145 (-) Transcript_58292:19-453(-)
MRSTGGEGERVPSVHSFAERFGNQRVFFHATMLQGSAFLWVGDQKLGLEDIHASVPTKYDTFPSVATLKGDVDGAGANLAQKLSKRFGMLVFLSFNLPPAEPELVLFVQKELTQFLRKFQAKPAQSPCAAGADAAATTQLPATD